jgi:predicted transcriptional regulator
MTNTDDGLKAKDNVIPLHSAKLGKASEKKWGRAVIKIGFSVVPSLLLRAQRRLHLSPTDLAVLLQLCDYWWDEARKPYPSKDSLSERLNLSPRQIQRIIANLEKEGLVKRIERRGLHGGKLSNLYDLTGLVTKLQNIEPDFRKVEEEAKLRRKAVARPGLRARVKAPE